MYQVFLGLGSNLGDRLENLSHAITEIKSISKIMTISSIYETEPVAMDIEKPFLNMVISVETSNEAPMLLAQIKKIEKKIGRKLPSHNEPRIIDIDILMYRGVTYEDQSITVPHPQLENRRFALQPLYEIAPTAVHPRSQKTIATLLRNCRDTHKVTQTDFNINYSITN